MILDLEANSVNEAVATPERQVLPIVVSHGLDLAISSSARASLNQLGLEISSMVLDLQNAFMGIPLSRDEYPF